MRRGVIAHGSRANAGIHHSVHFVPDLEGAPPNAVFVGWGFHNHLMRPHPLNRVVASLHLGDNGIVIVGVKPSPIADLPARFRIKRRVIKDDFTFLASLEFLRPLPILNDGQHFAIVRARLPIAFKLGFWKLLVGGIGSLLGRAFPGGASAGALLGHRVVKIFLAEY